MVSKTVTVAAIQLVSAANVAKNLKIVEGLIKQAVDQRAQLIVLPENFALMANSTSQLIACAEQLGSGEIQQFMADMSKQYNVWLIGGSIPIQSGDNNKALSACLVYDAKGKQVAQYNKLHLYDVDMIETGHSYRESDSFVAGDQVVIIETPFGSVGLSICYDLRFPELYRQMMLLGADIIVAPSAFTKETGAEHWSLLCRARAVENACYMIAPNQGGLHENGRETYGHSMIVDPWGRVLAEATVGPTVIIAKIDKTRQHKIRENFPAIEHGRFEYKLKRR